MHHGWCFFAFRYAYVPRFVGVVGLDVRMPLRESDVMVIGTIGYCQASDTIALHQNGGRGGGPKVGHALTDVCKKRR
jgi:hypothetical protein